MAEIPIYRMDLVALVDDEDLDAAMRHRWTINSKGYPIATMLHPLGGRMPCGRNRRTCLYLHRLVLGLDFGDPREVDHRNRDPLDNRRSNLRIGPHRLNMQNVSARAGHRGVSWYAPSGKWRAQARLDGRIHHLGYFETEEEAAEVARAWRRERMPFSEEAS